MKFVIHLKVVDQLNSKVSDQKIKTSGLVLTGRLTIFDNTVSLVDCSVELDGKLLAMSSMK